LLTDIKIEKEIYRHIYLEKDRLNLRATYNPKYGKNTMLLTNITPDGNNPMLSHFRSQFLSGDFFPIHPGWTESLESQQFIFSQSVFCQQEKSTGSMKCSFYAWSFLYC
jgi:hypothetical protein